MNPIPTQAEYRATEMARHHKFLTEIAAAPLADRQEAREDYRRLLLSAGDEDDNATLEARARWLLEGCYGYGPAVVAARIQAMKRGNRTAALGFLLAAYECRCPAPFAVRAWASLPPGARRRADAALRRALKAEASVTLPA